MYNLAPEFDFSITHQFPDFILDEIGELRHVLLVGSEVEEVEDRTGPREIVARFATTGDLSPQRSSSLYSAPSPLPPPLP